MTGKKEIPFVKMHGIGNDYIYVDALKGEIPEYLEERCLGELSRKISDRHFGVGSDGLILILPSDIADFRMRIFNADGSEAMMCGNGIRCVGKYVYDLGFTHKTHLTVETNSGVKTLDLKVGKEGVESVIVDMGSPFFKRSEIPVKGPGEEEFKEEKVVSQGIDYTVTAVGMGNPHGIVFVDQVKDLNLEEIGPGLEQNDIWPDRANIEFVKVVNPKEIKVRVWERGSGETMACGTGACASVVAANRAGHTQQEVTVHLLGGDLKIRYDDGEGKVYMEGPAEFVAKGIYWAE